MNRARLALTLAALSSTVTIYGCGGDLLNGVGAVDELTVDVGETLRDEVEAGLSSLTMGSSLDPIGTTQAAPDAASVVAVPCVSPSSAVDSDGDGVPDDATFVFIAPPCRFTGWRGGTLDIVGSLRIQDPSSTSAGFGYDATLTGLRSRFTGADANVIYDVTRNGTRTLSGSVTGLLLTADLQVIRTFAGHPDAAVDKQWSLNFTPSAPLQINGALPSGTLDIAGTIDWTRGTEHLVLTVSTPTPLEYDAGCTDTVQRIRAGEMTATGTFGDTDGIVRVTWRGCTNEPGFSFESTE
jgi:hypothetical protein